MSTTTPTLALTLYDSTTDQVVTFATFRAVWGGTAVTSNFYKIDTWAGTVNSSISTLQSQRGAIPVSAGYISANYYEATVASITSYVTGMAILLTLDTDSAGTVTLNISSLGTKSVMKVNSSGTLVNITSGELQSGRYYLFTYNGTQWVWVDANSSDQIYVVGGTSGNVLIVASDNSIEGTLTQSLLLSQTINSATAKATPVDADRLGVVDTEASNVLKYFTIGNLKSLIKSYYDSVSATLTNKTLTSPVISTISNTGTLTLPTSTDTLVGRNTTDTLTNKTITSRITTITSSATPTINTDNCDAVTITALATAITSMTTNLSGTPTNFQKLIFRIKDDGSIGYRMLTSTGHCDTVTGKYISGTTIEEAYSEPNMVEFDKWTYVVVKFVTDYKSECDLKYIKQRDGRLMFYVNGLLKASFLVGEMMAKRLDEYKDKQVGVPFNFSLGGGSQGLLLRFLFDQLEFQYYSPWLYHI